MAINVDRRSVRTCLEQHFVIPTYQRDYKWDSRQLQELIHDIQGAFLECYKDGHGRKDVGDYQSYFLGTIITTDAQQGAKAIVDGQQRITTLVLLMTYFFRKRLENDGLGLSDVGSMLRREVYGKKEFNVEFDADRAALFDLLLTEPADIDVETLDAKVDSIPNLSEGSKTLYRLFSQIEESLDDSIIEGLLPFFADFVSEKVDLFDINVPSEQDGHRVFVTMNDRGLRLGPIDLLKGFLLSNINNAGLNTKANERWTQCVRELRTLGSEEDSSFFKTLLRAQYAETIRGKSRGAAPGDFEIIGDAYHRWSVENAKSLGLNNSDDYYNWVDGLLPTFVSHYRAIKKYEKVFTSDFRHVFYNSAKNLTLQHMAILASIHPNDTSIDVEKKIKLVSWYMDRFATNRILQGINNNYDNIRDYVFALCKKIRRKTVQELLEIFQAEVANAGDFNPEGLDRANYFYMKSQDLLHLLARIAESLEESIEQTNRVGFSDYIDRLRGAKNFDIEHIIGLGKEALTEADPDVDDDGIQLSRYFRNEIGGLILLPRGKNRSLKDAPFSKKKPVYASENILAQTLVEGFYQNNPQLTAFVAESKLLLHSYEQFDRKAVDERRDLYNGVIDRIWDPGQLFALAE